MRPIVLSIAGSDPSGGAGIQADVKTIEANGAYAAAAISAVTAQNARGVQASEPLAAELVRRQLEAVLSDLRVSAIKTGMLGNAEIVSTVAACLRRSPVEHLVCDPVMLSGSGVPLLGDDGIAALRKELLPLATVATPNVPEARALTGLEIRDLEQAEAAARRILEWGPRAVLVKGGHLETARATDLLVTGGDRRTFAGRWVDGTEIHGTGCAYASAIAAHLALGASLNRAVAQAKDFVDAAIRNRAHPGSGAAVPDAFHAVDVGEGTP